MTTDIQKRNNRIIALTIVALFVIILGAVFFVVNPLRVQNIENAAAKFDPGDSWEVTFERTTGPSVLCIDMLCPQVTRHWRAQVGLTQTADDLAKLAVVDGEPMTIDDADCLTGEGAICNASKTVNEYRYLLDYSFGGDGYWELFLTVNEY